MADSSLGSEMPIHRFVTALASGDSAHGAVSAAAMAGAMGTSFLLMVAALPLTRSDAIDDRAVLLGVAAALGDVQEQLMETIETETAVKLFAARHMPRGNQTQRSAREAAIQLALRAGTDVPLEVMRLCALALKHAKTVAATSSRAAAREVEFAIALLQVGFNGARANLEGRLSSLTDVAYTKAVVEEIDQLTAEATTAVSAAERSVQPLPA